MNQYVADYMDTPMLHLCFLLYKLSEILLNTYRILFLKFQRITFKLDHKSQNNCARLYMPL